MARNSEKANSMLHRYLQQKAQSDTDTHQRRPYLSTLVDNVNECEKWRKHIINEIVSKITEIQNPNLSESTALQLNEYINKLLREKSHWERRIKQLGGNDYSIIQQNIYDSNNVIEIDKYYYFGVSKNNKLVQKLIQKKQYDIKHKYTLSQLESMVNGTNYYGNDDSENNMLYSIERELEQQLQHDAGYIDVSDNDINNDITNTLPTQQQQLTKQQIEQMLLEQKKAELLNKYK